MVPSDTMYAVVHSAAEPPGVDPYTGTPEEEDEGENGMHATPMEAPIGEDDRLPEERFHQADMVSQHMIDTREKQRKEKVMR